MPAVQPARVLSEKTNLPAETSSFIGRARELAEAGRLLEQTRLLTVTGAGGCGKTRLTLRLSRGEIERYPDGVWFVELAAVPDAALVAQTIASALRLPEAQGSAVLDRLVDYLRPRTLCLVLDNCEHIAEGVASVADRLLRACPGLRILASSREPLGVPGEVTWRLPSLELPADNGRGADLASLARCEAVELFVERAHASMPSFTLDEGNSALVVEVCRRLDGIPLAIELAAARLRVFSVAQVAERLDDRFRLLTGGSRTAMPRQQTLLATVDWSFNLLSEPERTLLRRLSVFSGGWTYDAVEGVCTGNGIETHALADLLSQLVDKSLVLAEGHELGHMRYRLLETIRQYARDRLEETAEAQDVRERHLQFFLRLAESCAARLRGHEERDALAQLDADHDNLRLALETSLAPGREQAEAALRLAGALAWFWYLRGYAVEGLAWLRRAFAASQAPTPERVRALYGAGWLAHHQRDAATARLWLEESLEIARGLGDAASEAWVLHVLGRVAYYEDDPASARALGEASLAKAREANDAWIIAYALHLLGLAAYLDADYPSARQYYSQSLELRRELGFEEGVGILLGLMGSVALREDDLKRAVELFREALITVRQVVGPWGMTMMLGSFACMAARSGQSEVAARLANATEALVGAYGIPLIPIFEPFLREAQTLARAALGDERYLALAEEGRRMTLDATMSEALALEVEGTATDSTGAGKAQSSVLTAAEREVLRRLCQGLTTREIASELVVAVSTVDRHLTHIYQKLGVRNRAEAVNLALRQNLI